MFTQELIIEKRLERLMGGSYRLDLLDEEFVQTLRIRLLADCKDKFKENVYRRIEEQTTRDRLLEACGYKIDDLEDLSNRLYKRKKKLKRMMKAVPYILQKEKDAEEKTEEAQRMVLEKKETKEGTAEMKKPTMIKYKVALVNDMDDRKGIDELYRMADAIVWRRTLAEEKTIECEVEEGTKHPVTERRISRASSVESDVGSDISHGSEERSEDEEDKKSIVLDEGTAVDSSFKNGQMDISTGPSFPSGTKSQELGKAIMVGVSETRPTSAHEVKELTEVKAQIVSILQEYKEAEIHTSEDFSIETSSDAIPDISLPSSSETTGASEASPQIFSDEELDVSPEFSSEVLEFSVQRSSTVASEEFAPSSQEELPEFQEVVTVDEENEEGVPAATEEFKANEMEDSSLTGMILETNGSDREKGNRDTYLPQISSKMMVMERDDTEEITGAEETVTVEVQEKNLSEETPKNETPSVNEEKMAKDAEESHLE